jgi:hypothetical protein
LAHTPLLGTTTPRPEEKALSTMLGSGDPFYSSNVEEGQRLAHLLGDILRKMSNLVINVLEDGEGGPPPHLHNGSIIVAIEL